MLAPVSTAITTGAAVSGATRRWTSGTGATSIVEVSSPMVTAQPVQVCDEPGGRDVGGGFHPFALTRAPGDERGGDHAGDGHRGQQHERTDRVEQRDQRRTADEH